MNKITIKDSAGIDKEFNVIRQPAGSQSAILMLTVTGAGMNRTANPKIELSAPQSQGRSTPVVTVTVPYGAVVNGNYQKEDQVVFVHSAKQPPTAPEMARLDAEAFARNVVANPQVMALFKDGVIS